MVDRINVNFPVVKSHLYTYAKENIPNFSEFVMNCIEMRMQTEKNGTCTVTEQSQNTQKPDKRTTRKLAEITLIDDIKAYGGVSAFLNYNSVQNIKIRIDELYAKHPAEADAVVLHIIGRYPALKRILGERNS